MLQLTTLVKGIREMRGLAEGTYIIGRGNACRIRLPFPDVSERRNASLLGYGVVVTKYTGARGKSGSNDANAEYIAHLRKILDAKKVVWQTAELGAVDAGGGGTIAYILALYGMNVIDSGVAVLNMHAPWECTSKADIYEAYRGYKAFAEGASL